MDYDYRGSGVLWYGDKGTTQIRCRSSGSINTLRKTLEDYPRKNGGLCGKSWPWRRRHEKRNTLIVN